jgi:type I restriction enzyme S subunit
MEAGKAVEKSHGFIVLGLIGADKHSTRSLLASFKPITWFLPMSVLLQSPTKPRALRTVALHEIARHHSGNGKLIKGKLHSEPVDGLYPAFSASGQDVWHTEYGYEGDAIIVSAVGARCGKCFIAQGRWSAIANTHVVWPDPEKIELKYLWYLLNDEQFWIRSGSAQPFVSTKKTFEKEIPLPSLDEQREIVAEIEKQFTRLEAGVVALKRVQGNLKRYRAAVLKAACEGKLVPTEASLAKAEGHSYETGEKLLQRILTERRKNWTGRCKYKEPATPDATNLPELPEGWAWATPDQLSDFDEGAICAGPFGTIFKARDFRPSGVPIIFLRHVAPGRYLTHKPGFMDERKWEELFRPYSVFGGELLITKLGEPPGVCAIYPEGIGPAMVTPDVMKMTPNPRAALPKFLMHYFNSQTARDFATGVAFGTTRLRLTLPIFREMPVPLPPLAEQERIVEEVERRLSVMEEMEATVSTNLQRTTRLRQSILQKAFN